MSRSEDNNSWAAKVAASPEHAQLMAEMSLDSAVKALETFKKSFPSVYDYWEAKRRRTQSASEGSAKSLLVGSTPTSCSNTCDRIRCPDCELCSTVEVEDGVYHCNNCEANFTTS